MQSVEITSYYKHLNDQNGDLSDFMAQVVVPGKLFRVFQKLLLSWYFHAPQSLEFVQDGVKYIKQNHSVSSSNVGGTTLLMNDNR